MQSTTKNNENNSVVKCCQKCYDLCPMDIFILDEEIKMPRVAYEEECRFCGICFMECPKPKQNTSDVIRIVEKAFID